MATDVLGGHGEWQSIPGPLEDEAV